MPSRKYNQIADQLRKQVVSGFRGGSRLPSERELAETFDVSRMTMRKAIGLLIDEGILEQRPGSGTYVVFDRVIEDFGDLISFSQLMQRAGKRPSSKVVNFKTTFPTTNETEQLDIKDNEKIIVMERLRFGDNQPIAYEVTSIPQYYVKNVSKEDMVNSFYQSLGQLGLIPKSAKHNIQAHIADTILAELLQVKVGDPILYVRQTSYLSNGRPFEYVRTHYAADRYQIFL